MTSSTRNHHGPHWRVMREDIEARTVQATTTTEREAEEITETCNRLAEDGIRYTMEYVPDTKK